MKGGPGRPRADRICPPDAPELLGDLHPHRVRADQDIFRDRQRGALIVCVTVVAFTALFGPVGAGAGIIAGEGSCSFCWSAPFPVWHRSPHSVSAEARNRGARHGGVVSRTGGTPPLASLIASSALFVIVLLSSKDSRGRRSGISAKGSYEPSRGNDRQLAGVEELLSQVGVPVLHPVPPDSPPGHSA